VNGASWGEKYTFKVLTFLLQLSEISGRVFGKVVIQHIAILHL
jgi:hypothetical protein